MIERSELFQCFINHIKGKLVWNKLVKTRSKKLIMRLFYSKNSEKSSKSDFSILIKFSWYFDTLISIVMIRLDFYASWLYLLVFHPKLIQLQSSTSVLSYFQRMISGQIKFLHNQKVSNVGRREVIKTFCKTQMLLHLFWWIFSKRIHVVKIQLSILFH